MRFDDEAYLVDYRSGKFPVIHDDLFHLLTSRSMGASYCDLCGNSGLLGQRIIDVLDWPCILVEGNLAAIELAAKYATTIPKFHLKIQQATYPRLKEILTDHKVDVLVARRCISELFTGVDDPLRFEWEAMLADSGVKEVFLQGRATTKRATHPIPNVSAEIQCFPSLYKAMVVRKQLAYLRLI